ncbi:MAG: LamG domain-containing protein [Pseudomonadota bacterium]
MLLFKSLSAPAVAWLVSPLKAFIVVTCLIVVSACGGSSGGGGNSSTPATSTTGTTTITTESINYTGPAPRANDVQNFRSSLWSQLAVPSRCGSCHDVGGSGSPAFMNTADINSAYDTSLGLVNLSDPSSSRLVTIVLEGHNCWLSSDAVCGNLISSWIQQWASAGATSSFLGALNLSDPVLKTIGQSKQFPASADDGSAVDFESTVYSLTRQYCAACHSENSALQQQPFIGSDDPQVAYEAARTRINLEDADVTVGNAVSRLIVRLRDEGHHCWNGSCANSAAAMHASIVNFSGALPLTTVDPELVTSRALTLNDGLAASTGGGRVESNVIAKWSFSSGSGSTAFDESGVDPAIDLTIQGNVEWLASGGVRINSGKLRGSTVTSAKLYDRIRASGEYSIEAWVVPLNVTQDGPARIVTYSGATDRRNFTLGQTTYDYDFLARSSTTDANGLPALSTPMADEVLQATLQHVVATYSATEGRQIYVNGVLVTDDLDPQGPGHFDSWDRNFALALGDEVSNDNQWQGSIRLLAIHDRALAAEDVATNYDIGVGQKFYLLFSISDHISIPRSYIVMQVEQFDDHGYLFNEPFFVSLESGVTIADVPLQGMRIGVNGQQTAVGQAYASLDTTITQADVDAGEGRQILASVGTIIGVDQGPDVDEFFLTFELLGSESNVFVEGTPAAQTPSPSTEQQSDIGIKTFDEINEALSALTGIGLTNTDVATTFSEVKQQLPVAADIQGFASAQQMAVTQLAVKYCDVLIDQESGGGATGYFSGFDFNAVPTSALDASGRSDLIDTLLDRLLANTVSTGDQPSFLDAEAELDSLITTLLGNCSADGCSQNGDRVADIAIATCAAAFGSGMMLIQ